MLRTIRESVDAGEYASTSEVLRDAMRLWQRQRAEDNERLNVIRDRIRRSIGDPRPSLTGDELHMQMEAFIAQADKDFKNATP